MAPRRAGTTGAMDGERGPAPTDEPIRVATLGTRIVTLLPRAGYETAFVPERGVVGFAFESQRGHHAFAGDRLLPFQAWPNTLSWVPPGCSVRSRSTTGGEYLTIESPETGEEVDEGTRAGLARRRANRFNDRRDERARRAAGALRAALLSGVGDTETLEAHVLVLDERVDALLGVAGAPASASGWLTAARLRRVDEWIEAHLAERRGVAALAAELGLSAGFLTRAMKAATGRSPHDYVVDRRVARARELLRGTRRPIADIALECGFSSHSHLGTAFGRRIGVPPGAFRRRERERQAARGR